MRFISFLILLSVMTTQATAQMGALYLPENGTPSSGTAQAGSAAVSRDASTAWLNVAGMTRLEQGQFMNSLQAANVDIRFDQSPATTATGGDGSQQGTWIPAGGMFLAVPIEDNIWFGFSFTGVSGLGLDPDNTWSGRYFVTETDLAVVDLQPSVGIRLNEQWSIGAGVNIQYADFEQRLAVNRPGPLPDGSARINGDSWDVGFSLYALYEISETTRLGFRYRSEVDHELGGDFTALIGVADVTASLTIPQAVTLSGYHDINEQWAIMADVGWQEWSAYDRTVISIDGGISAVAEIPRNFDDTWYGALGAHYRFADDWMLLFGGAYVTSAVGDASRTPDLPVDEQIRMAIGLEHDINAKWTVGGNYTMVWLGDNNTNASLNPSTGRLYGDYDAFLHVLGFYALMRF